MGRALFQVDDVSVERPHELDVHGGVVGHLAGQDHALAHRDVQGRRRDGEDSTLCGEEGRYCRSSSRTRL